MKKLVACCTLFTAFFSAISAHSQVMGADLGIGTGVEAGDDGTGSTAFRRARTRLRAQVMWQTEEGGSGMSALAFFEVEPHTSFGSELRYTYAFSHHLEAFGGATATFVPHLLFGGTAGAAYMFGKSNLRFFIEPSISAMPLGSDLPTNGVLMWGLLTVGVRGDISSLVAEREGDEK